MITVLGVGNILFGDEGFGSHFASLYKKEFEERFNGKVKVIDGGVHSIPLIPMVEDSELLIIIDALKPKRDTRPGDIFVFDKEDIMKPVPSKIIMTSHDGGIWELLDTLELLGKLPKSIKLIAVVPEDISTKIGLSKTLSNVLPEVRKKVEELIIGSI